MSDFCRHLLLKHYNLLLSCSHLLENLESCQKQNKKRKKEREKDGGVAMTELFEH